MNDPASLAALVATVEKLARRLEDVEAALGEQREMLRLIVDGRVGRAIAPVTTRLCQSEEMTATMRLLLDVLAGAIVAACLVGGLLYYLVDKPWPLSLQIPPPHSTQQPKERPG